MNKLPRAAVAPRAGIRAGIRAATAPRAGIRAAAAAVRALILLLLAAACAIAAPRQEYKFYPLKELDYDKELALIGKVIYFDVNFTPQKLSCNDCHDLNISGSGSSSSGENTDGELNPPTVLNVAHSGVFFYDGQTRFVRDQVRKTLLRQPGTSEQKITRMLSRNNDYKAMFKKVNMKPNFESAVEALANFEMALSTLAAPIDRYLSGDHQAISAQAKAGFRLFNYLGCSSCHNGINFGGSVITRMDASHIAGCGSGAAQSFKVPTLRNITLSAPYGSRGQFLELEDMVRAMIICQTNTIPEDEQVDAIMEFLKTLEGKRPRILNDND